MSEPGNGQDQVERGGMDEEAGVPVTETEIETSKKPEDRDTNV
ncbi:hypothetical protein [Blastococcus sp. SYSU D00813]